MIAKLKDFCRGLQFRFLVLVLGLASSLMIVELAVDTTADTRESSEKRLAEALNLTNIVARSLEKQFQYFDLTEIEEILTSIRNTRDVTQVTVIDRDRTFFLDGDPATSSVLAFEDNPVQNKSLESAKTEFIEMDSEIIVAEPLIQSGQAIGSVLVKYAKPTYQEIFYPILWSKISGTVPILLIGLFISSVLVAQITRPLRRLAESAQEFCEGNLKNNVEVTGAREIRLLGDAFSNMLERIRENIEQIHKLAYVDRVTQLPNREFFRRELTRSIHRAERSGIPGALLFVDLDGFKKVNDTMGHDLGDKLLLYFSERIQQTLRREDLVGFDTVIEDGATLENEEQVTKKNKQMLARLGGDEFTILVSEIREETDAATVARRIIKAVSEPFEIDGSMITIGASIGIATFPRDGSDYQTVLKSADMAMYQAKEDGKGRYRYFSEELNDRASNRMSIETDLRAALKEGDQLELFYQPKIDCQTGKPKGAEALVRWRHPVKGMIPPLDFIKIAEETGLILPLGKWIMNEACRNIKEFQDLGLDMAVAVNISTPQFEHPDFVDEVKAAVKSSGIETTRLELEITESLAMSDPEKALRHINQLKKIGIRIAIDDFGTGYSNLSQLSRLPFDVFKIDRSFVDGIGEANNPHDQTIVRTILAMAKSLNYQTVAEGVENYEQWEFLKENKCDFVQGYYFARPMPRGEIDQWMKTFQPVSKQKQISDKKVA